MLKIASISWVADSKLFILRQESAKDALHMLTRRVPLDDQTQSGRSSGKTIAVFERAESLTNNFSTKFRDQECNVVSKISSHFSSKSGSLNTICDLTEKLKRF